MDTTKEQSPATQSIGDQDNQQAADCKHNKPPFTILIAGHRPDRLPEDCHKPNKLFDNLDRLLGEHILPALSGHDQPYQPRILTGIAKGCDQAVINLIQDKNNKIDCPLHILTPEGPDGHDREDQAIIEIIYKKAERIVMLDADKDGNRNISDEVHELRNRSALAFADLVLVIWDGKAPKGNGGGTARLVLQAALSRKPVIWLDCNGRLSHLVLEKLDNATLLKLKLEQPYQILSSCFEEIKDWQQLDTAKSINWINKVCPVDPLNTENSHSPRKNRAGGVHELCIAIISCDVKKFRGSLCQCLCGSDLTPYWGPAKPKEDEKKHPIHPIHPIKEPSNYLGANFEQADIKANVASGRHRDLQWLLYGCSALAVFTAVAGHIHLWMEEAHLWALLELVLIGVIIAGFLYAGKKDVHHLWLRERFIAEQLRYARMGYPLMIFSRLFYQPAQIDGSSKKTSIGSPDIVQHVQRVLIREGLPQPKEGNVYVPSKYTNTLAKYILDIVNDQCDYHRNNGNDQCNNHKDAIKSKAMLHHRLERIAILLFVMTGIAIVLHLSIHAEWLSRYVLIFTAALPAMAAAIHGVLTKMEFKRLAQQHTNTFKKLENIISLLEELYPDVDQSGPQVTDNSEPEWLRFRRLQQLALHAASTMSDENRQWQELLSNQDTEIPA